MKKTLTKNLKQNLKQDLEMEDKERLARLETKVDGINEKIDGFTVELKENNKIILETTARMLKSVEKIFSECANRQWVDGVDKRLHKMEENEKVRKTKSRAFCKDYNDFMEEEYKPLKKNVGEVYGTYKNIKWLLGILGVATIPGLIDLIQKIISIF